MRSFSNESELLFASRHRIWSARNWTCPRGVFQVPERSTRRFGSCNLRPVHSAILLQKNACGSVVALNCNAFSKSNCSMFVGTLGFIVKGRNPEATATLEVWLVTTRLDKLRPCASPLSLRPTSSGPERKDSRLVAARPLPGIPVADNSTAKLTGLLV